MNPDTTPPAVPGMESSRFRRGLVVGKFAPLHQGHELLLMTALRHCDEVLAISYARPEPAGCEAVRREAWLAARFPGIRRLVVTDARLREWFPDGSGPTELPWDDAPATVHRQFCARLCEQVFGTTVDAVFTSEDYGAGFAGELTQWFRRSDPGHPAVVHVSVDAPRGRVPVSGTEIRRDVHAQRQWLSREVYASFVQRVAVLGGESSGKTTLARALGQALGTVCAEEYGRELWEARQGALRFEDYVAIAREQVAREETGAREAFRFLICDTTPLTTWLYCRHDFGHADPALERMAARTYDFTVLCEPDFEFQQDGTRRGEAFRRWQHAAYLRELAGRGLPFMCVTGTLAERVARVLAYLGAETTPVGPVASSRRSKADPRG